MGNAGPTSLLLLLIILPQVVCWSVFSGQGR
jgi:hypothetical protein